MPGLNPVLWGLANSPFVNGFIDSIPFTAHTLSGKGETSRAHLMLGMGKWLRKSISIVYVVVRKMEAVGPPPGARLCLPGQAQPDSGSLMNRARKGKEKR